MTPSNQIKKLTCSKSFFKQTIFHQKNKLSATIYVFEASSKCSTVSRAHLKLNFHSTPAAGEPERREVSQVQLIEGNLIRPGERRRDINKAALRLYVQLI